MQRKLDAFMKACEPERLLLGEVEWFTSVFVGETIFNFSILDLPETTTIFYAAYGQTLIFSPKGYACTFCIRGIDTLTIEEHIQNAHILRDEETIPLHP